MQKITPFFWFDKEAEEAAAFYVSVFKSVFGDAELGTISRYGKEAAAVSGQPEGTAMVVSFKLRGENFTALNGGKPEGFDTKFTGAISFVVDCDTQEQIDGLWDDLTAHGGEPSQCGWLKDKFGITWQIVPSSLSDYIGGPDKEGDSRAMTAMLSMTKFDIAKLKKPTKANNLQPIICSYETTLLPSVSMIIAMKPGLPISSFGMITCRPLFHPAITASSCLSQPKICRAGCRRYIILLWWHKLAECLTTAYPDRRPSGRNP